MDARSILRRLAGWPWRWCLRRTDGRFKTDAEGRHVYFPNGHAGAGRIVPSEAEYARLRRRLAMPFACLLLLIPLPSMLPPILTTTVATAGGVILIIVTLLRRYPAEWAISAERLTLREVLEKSPGMRRAGWTALAVSLLVSALALFLLVSQWDQPEVVHPGIALMALAVLACWLSIGQIRWIRRVRKGSDQ